MILPASGGGADRGPVVWTPTEELVEQAGVTRFLQWLATHRGVQLAGYPELWEWSVEQIEEFWSAIWDFSGVVSANRSEVVLADRSMPGAVWFPQARLNFAENALQRDDDDPIIRFHREDGVTRAMTAHQLRVEVAALASSMRRLGVGRGDRVAAVLPNCPEAIVACLATVSIGAIWTLCGPETGPRALTERFAQVQPVLLISVDGCVYAGREREISRSVAEVIQACPSITNHVLIGYLDQQASCAGALAWNDLVAGDHSLEFEPVPFDHPLWIVYSSGTTGRPKAIVQGHGGIVVEQLKVQTVQQCAPPAHRHVAMTLASPSWIVWNLQISYLLSGTTIVVYDGSPLHPSPARIWDLVAKERVSLFRASSAWILECLRSGLSPGVDHDLSSLRTLLATGSPLPSEAFHWVVEQVGAHVQPASSSGGTEVATALVTAVPVMPIRAGEIQCRALGVAVDAFDPDGAPVWDQVGELVVKAPMPSMPLYLWNDHDGRRLQETYFEKYPGVWWHGDWIRLHRDGGSVILGRSDASLNRGGVRIGAAEFYDQLAQVGEVADSLVVDLPAKGSGGELLLFLKMRPGAVLDDRLRDRIRDTLKTQLSPRHVPDRLIAVGDLPYTLTGKKCEVPIKRILLGAVPNEVVDFEALRNPDALQYFAELALDLSV